MGRLLVLLCYFTVSFTIASFNLSAEEADPPGNYRNWIHTKSGIIEPGHPVFAASEGIHHIYANKEALKGLQTGIYAEGAVFVADFLTLQTVSHLTTEQKRIRIDVMQFDPQRFAKSGGWGYASFKDAQGTQRIAQDTQ